MRKCQPISGFLTCLSGLLCMQSVFAEPNHPHQPYLLSIKLAPAFCVLNPDRQKTKQCQEGYAIIVHGLWKEKAASKEDAPCTERPPELSPLQQQVLERIMPDEDMRNKAWQRYGACTGMSAQEYFRVVMSYANKLRLPNLFKEETRDDREFEQEFLVQEIQKMNVSLPEKGFYLRCQTKQDKTFLTEVRVCYDKLGQFAECKNYQPNCPQLITLRAIK